MKYFFSIALLAPFAVSAQDCNIKKTVDPYTKETRISTGFIKFDEASLAIEADSKEIDFFFSMDGKEKCFSDESAAIIMYEGTKMKGNFKNNGAVNCDGSFHIIFKNMPTSNSLMQRLITQKITSIQFNGNNKSQTTISFSPEEQQTFMVKADCLIKQAKTLIK